MLAPNGIGEGSGWLGESCSPDHVSSQRLAKAEKGNALFTRGGQKGDLLGHVAEEDGLSPSYHLPITCLSLVALILREKGWGRWARRSTDLSVKSLVAD
jgi:hypothetical protein